MLTIKLPGYVLRDITSEKRSRVTRFVSEHNSQRIVIPDTEENYNRIWPKAIKFAQSLSRKNSLVRKDLLSKEHSIDLKIDQEALTAKLNVSVLLIVSTIAKQNIHFSQQITIPVVGPALTTCDQRPQDTFEHSKSMMRFKINKLFSSEFSSIFSHRFTKLISLVSTISYRSFR